MKDSVTQIEQTETAKQTETLKQTISEKAGYIPEETVIQIDSEAEKEPSALSTKGTFWGRGGKRTLSIGGAVLAVVLFLGTITGTMMNSLNNQKEKAPPQQTNQPQKKDDTEDIGAMKTNNAIGSQRAELKQMSEPVPIATPTPTSTATPTLNPKPTPTVRPLSRDASLPPQRQIQIVHAPAPERIHSSAPFSPPRQPPQIMAVQQRSLPSAISTPTPVPSIDPNVAWQAAANVGMYGDGTDGSDDLPHRKDVKPTPEVTPNTAPTADYNSGRSVIVGSHASGRLETALAWIGNGNAQNQQSYLIKLTEPLKSADGTVIIPKEAMIVAHIKTASEAGLLDMSAVSIVVREKDAVVEKSIPEGAILVQDGGGNPLKAEYKLESHFGADVRTAALAGIGKASEIYNSSDSSISISNGSGIATTNNGRRNVLAGVLQGSSQELVNRARQANNQRNQQNNSNARILTLDKGASVRIFANRSFSL